MKEGSLRMGASPQTPWLHGAGAPLRSPPGGAFRQTVCMGDETHVELAPIERKIVELTNCSIVLLVSLSLGELFFGELTKW